MSDSEFKFSTLPPLPDTRGIDLDKVSPLYGRPSQKSRAPEYIPYNRRGRDLYGRLTINTGYFWLGGFGLGGAYGVQEGWRGAASTNTKIRLNSVLNAASRRGAHLASSLGIIAFMHTLGVAFADYLELEKRTNLAVVTPLFAGALTGAIYTGPSLMKGASGIRPFTVATITGGALSCAYWYGTTYLNDVVFRKRGRF